MIVYRLSKSKYADDLSGRGAEITGGRWNSKGFPVIYTSSSRALCMAEIAVHTPLGIMPHDFKMISLEIPGYSILEIHLDILSNNWSNFPYPGNTQKVGDNFIKAGEFLILKVPSAVVKGDFNYLINPRHKDFDKVKITDIEDFSFDERLFKKKF